MKFYFLSEEVLNAFEKTERAFQSFRSLTKISVKAMINNCIESSFQIDNFSNEFRPFQIRIINCVSYHNGNKSFVGNFSKSDVYARNYFFQN